jgi:putative phosphoesterase
MKIAVMSDAHDNIWNVEKALQRLDGVDALVFCGDLCAPFTLKMLADGFKGPVHAVRGNNDGDVYLLMKVAQQAGNVTLYIEAMAQISVGDKKIAAVHYDHLADAIAPSHRFDAVFFGHSHQAVKRWEGRTLVLNPGEVMGRFGKPSFALYDAEKHDAEFVEF